MDSLSTLAIVTGVFIIIGIIVIYYLVKKELL